MTVAAAPDALATRLPPPLDEAAAARASLALAVLAVDPGVGALLVGRPSPARRAWIEALTAALSPLGPVRKLPPGADADALSGGLDLESTLASGRPVATRGLLAESDGGLLVIPQAELLRPEVAAVAAAALDTGERRLERHGLSGTAAARVGVLALAEVSASEGEDGEGRSSESPWPGLVDRLGLVFAVPPRWRVGIAASDHVPTAAEVEAARIRLGKIEPADDEVRALCDVALTLGVRSLRAPLQAVRAARAVAALRGAAAVGVEDLEAAAALVLAPRRIATAALPPEVPPEAGRADEPPPPVDRGESTAPDAPEGQGDPATDGSVQTAERLADRVLAAARTRLPPDLLAGLDAATVRRGRGPSEAGRRGARRRARGHGRPLASRAGEPTGAADLDVLATIRAAAPWQRARARTASDGASPRLRIRPPDFRVRERERRSGTLTVFAVDASGSQTLHRLAETKGAVELLLAEGYARRDQVALVSFRDRSAEIALPPTRALARARRILSALPGGGPTPLAAGLEATHRIVERARRDGQSVAVVVLTDGRANVARDGRTGREAGEADALAAARYLGAAGAAAIVIDTSRRGSPFTERLAETLGGSHARLPVPRARELGRLAREVAASAKPA